MENEDQKELLVKYLSGQCSEEEKAAVETWYLAYADEREDRPAEFDYQSTEDQIWLSIENEHRPVPRSLWPGIIAAAMVLICIGIGFLFLSEKEQHHETAKTKTSDIVPGGNKAILTLGNGEQLSLNNLKNGIVVSEGNIEIKKDKDGAIKYRVVPDKEADVKTAYNMVSTPKGGQYSIVLADGTTATLDALSSIRFPTSFDGSLREVTTTGQVYFEVAHNAKKPFRVNTKNQVVEVLGTHFNVNSYEPVLKTTLLQGSVKVIENGVSVLLKPGEQARTELNHKIDVRACDMEEVIAWKNGFFQFNNAGIRSVMDELARWYDIDVIYEGRITDRRFSGKIYKNVNISQVLSILSFSKVHFKMEGKRIIVTPQ